MEINTAGNLRRDGSSTTSPVSGLMLSGIFSGAGPYTAGVAVGVGEGVTVGVFVAVGASVNVALGSILEPSPSSLAFTALSICGTSVGVGVVKRSSGNLQPLIKRESIKKPKIALLMVVFIFGPLFFFQNPPISSGVFAQDLQAAHVSRLRRS